METINDCDKFFKTVGIADREKLHEHNMFSDEECGFFHSSKLPRLVKFVEENPDWHIATKLDDVDDNGSWIESIDNSICRVNVEGYYLCNGSKEDLIYENAYDCTEEDK